MPSKKRQHEEDSKPARRIKTEPQSPNQARAEGEPPTTVSAAPQRNREKVRVKLPASDDQNTPRTELGLEIANRMHLLREYFKIFGYTENLVQWNESFLQRCLRRLYFSLDKLAQVREDEDEDDLVDAIIFLSDLDHLMFNGQLRCIATVPDKTPTHWIGRTGRLQLQIYIKAFKGMIPFLAEFQIVSVMDLHLTLKSFFEKVDSLNLTSDEADDVLTEAGLNFLQTRT